MRIPACRYLSVLFGLGLALWTGALAARETSPLVVARDGQSQITIVPEWLDLRDLSHDEAQIQVGSRLLNQYLIVLTEPRPADVTLAEGPSSIERQDRERQATIGANLPVGVAAPFEVTLRAGTGMRRITGDAIGNVVLSREPA